MQLQDWVRNIGDQLFLRASSVPGQYQAGAIPYTVVKGQAVFLLVTSRRTGRWIFPKGQEMKGKEPWEVAAYEAFEEAGVRGEIETSPIGSYWAVKMVGIRRTPIKVDMYPLRMARQFTEWPEKGKRLRHWAILPEAKRLLSDPGLYQLAATLSRRIAPTT